MSAVFLYLYDRRGDARALEALLESSARYLPIAAQRQHRWRLGGGHCLVGLYCVAPQSARGGFWAQESGSQRGVVYNGWFREPLEVPLEQTMAEGLLDRLAIEDVAQLSLTMEGDWSLLSLDEAGDGAGATDFLGGSHLYFGERDGLAVVSNRAMMVAAALHGGALPRPRPMFYSWLLSSLSAPLGEETAWPGVSIVEPGRYLVMRQGRLSQRRKPSDARGANWSWTREIAQFRRRVAQIARIPGYRMQMALTGGKDSRAVLAGVLGAGVEGELERIYLSASPDHPDARVARGLAEHYGLPFELVEPTRSVEEDFFSRLARHNFLSECALRAWDLKIKPPVMPARGSLHGNYGEIFRSHLRGFQIGGWAGVRRHYLGQGYLNPQGLLSARAQQHLRQRMLDWLEERRGQGVEVLAINDRMHREGRMHRWVGQGNQADGLGSMSINPLPSRELLNRYLAQGVRQQRAHRIHFELIRSLDDWLWRQPFAGVRWSRQVMPLGRRAARPVRGDGAGLSRQLADWERWGASILDSLGRDWSPELEELLDRGGFESFLPRVRREAQRGDVLAIKSAYALVGIKEALAGALEPVQLRVESDDGG